MNDERRPDFARPSPARSALGTIAPWAAAVACALCAIWFGGRYALAIAEKNRLQTERDLAVVATKTAQINLAMERLTSDRLASDLASLKPAATAQHAESAERQDDGMRLAIAMLRPPASAPSNATAVAVWDPVRQQGVLTVDRLAASGPNHRYEAWLIDDAAIPAGSFQVGPDGHAKLEFRPARRVQAARQFAVSREKDDAGNVPASPGEIVLSGSGQ
jgi:hypothetical protein